MHRLGNILRAGIIVMTVGFFLRHMQRLAKKHIDRLLGVIRTREYPVRVGALLEDVEARTALPKKVSGLDLLPFGNTR